MGTVRISVCGRRVKHQAAIALVKRSPKITANWTLAMPHLTGRHLALLFGAVNDKEEELHRGLVGRKTTYSPERAAQLSIQGFYGVRGVQDPTNVKMKCTERHDLAPGAPPVLGDGRVAAAPEAFLEGA